MTGSGGIPDELHTILDFIRWSCSRFQAADLNFGHGTDNALDEAHHLILGALQLPYSIPQHFYSARLTLEEKQNLLKLIEKRTIEKKPVPYLLNEAWFAGMPFYVDERVLIPRSPIAELIEAGFSPWIAEKDVHNVLDLCTGSGCIGIACAMAFPESHVDAADLSADALEVAALNVDRYNLSHQVQIVESDLFAQLPRKQYDIIVSNPPYVDASEMASLAAEYEHEPVLGLAAGQDGLDVVRQLLADASDYLSDHGILVVEVGISQYALESAYPDVPFIWLDFERGGEGVFLISAAELAGCREVFQR